MAETVKLGFFGLKNREDTIRAAANLHDRGVKIAAFFDKDPEAAAKAAEGFPKAAVCATVEEFIASGVNAAVIGDCAKGRADIAARLMQNGIAVLAGCMPMRTLSDCVKLCRLVEQTGAKYMFATPLAYTAQVLEMKKAYEAGRLGKIIYGEGEYISDGKDVCPGVPALYYGTRALLPLMQITGETPVKIVSKVPFNHRDAAAIGCKGPDTLPETLVTMTNGSVLRIGASCDMWPKGIWYRVGTTCGGTETVRGDFGSVTVSYFKGHQPEEFGEDTSRTYTAEYDASVRRKYKDLDNAVIAEALMLAEFIGYVRGENETEFDVYAASTVASVLLMSGRSAVNDGIVTLLPDWHVEGIRKMYVYDFQTPVPNELGFVNQPGRAKPIC